MNKIEFLRERIAEDERGAATHPGEWWSDRLKRECHAKRRLLDFHESWPVLVRTKPELEMDKGMQGLGSVVMRLTEQMDFLTVREYRERFGDEPPTSLVIDELVRIYDDHPNFQEEWL